MLIVKNAHTYRERRWTALTAGLFLLALICFMAYVLTGAGAPWILAIVLYGATIAAGVHTRATRRADAHTSTRI